jgi:Protein of unknown function (DUF3048) N-terminal domain/Protein of unknown function (DUF3048) C-terminal domain
MIRRKALTFTVIGVLAATLAACGGGDSSSTQDSTTTVEGEIVPGVLYPLTGLEVTDPIAAGRTALAVKIDNHPTARPQAGLNKADIVFEENVEGITRFIAVFHSEGSDPVGPIRSGRIQDIDLLSSFNKPLFAWSGGNANVTRAVNSSSLVNVGHSASKGKGGYFRSQDRKAPHNLYAQTKDLWSLTPEGSGPPPVQFTFRGDSDANPATSTPFDGAKVSMTGLKVFWKWDGAAKNFVRFTENSRRQLEPHVSDDVQVNAKNVIVVYASHERNAADNNSIQAVTVGKGTGFVLTDGGLIQMNWERAKADTPFTFTDTAGAVIRMTAGRTWVEVARRNSLAAVGIGVDPATVAWPVP